MKSSIKLYIFIAILIFSVDSKANYLNHPSYEEIAKILVEKHEFSPEYIESVFKSATKQKKIIEAVNSPAEFTYTWQKYRRIFIEYKRIRNGKKFIKNNFNTLERAEAVYGVPKEIITAIIGVETRYGKIMGTYRAIDALATLAFDYPRRSKFFSNELIHLLILCRENNLDLFKIKGSYAGAMGFGQFIPTSYLAYAVDFDNNGSVDLFGSVEDAIGSVANYLSKHGWEAGKPVVWKTTNFLSIIKDPALINNVKKLSTVENFDKDFLTFKNSQFVRNESFMPLQFDMGMKKEFYLGSKNFIAITKYNRSHFYAKAVYDLSLEF